MKTAAIIGMGGYAQAHHRALHALEGAGEARLVATCDLQPEQFPEAAADLEARGVPVYRDYLEMLDAHQNELDFVTVPTPIPLHAPMHRACVERGLAVYLEKPPTLDWRELERMIEVDKGARFQTQVGFNFIVEEPRQSLKARLVSGEFGALQSAGLAALWPRPESYFERAAWAGRLKIGDHLVLDSCAGNALAHYVHNLLFWCGDELFGWGAIESVEAELYRAHAIESFDTVFARAQCGGTGGGVPIWVGLSHAGSGASWQREWFECERATISYASRGEAEIVWKDGRRETVIWKGGELLTRNLRHFIGTLGGENARPLTTLEDSRPFVIFNDLLFVAARQIAVVPEPFVCRHEGYAAIENIEAALENCAANASLPSERGIAWGKRGGRARADEVAQLESVIEALLNGG